MLSATAATSCDCSPVESAFAEKDEQTGTRYPNRSESSNGGNQKYPVSACRIEDRNESDPLLVGKRRLRKSVLDGVHVAAEK